ncbi:nitrous oxidase accessory protein [Halovivax ruber XH-70]|uniref:Nitrous oxidase accessory protein n=1 Tax=Halovivax ruber (strain DSM 18193 / JCM 13892 / XH-70) TaxID=797302 RepID=L0I7R2_HALRX|nr:right-handed parallel beta-helix repeat-containing protein [Halovivax ruber]AGB14803.1 nitrous oxidase accessory protein [Halovivax ruber XH-70]
MFGSTPRCEGGPSTSRRRLRLLGVLLVGTLVLVGGIGGATIGDGAALDGLATDDGSPTPAHSGDSTTVYGTCETTVTDGSSVQDAVNDSSPGETICVEAGEYAESVTIDVEGLSLVAADPVDPPILNGSSLEEGTNGFSVDGANDVTVSGFEVREFAGNGVHAIESDGLEVTDAAVLDNDLVGVLVNGSAGATVRGINATNNGWADDVPGIRLYESPNALVENNTANSNARQGINVWEHSDGAVVRNNTANDNDRSGIYVQDADDAVIEDNTANSNGLRAVHLEAINVTSIQNTTVRNTVGVSNTQSGILVQGADGTLLEGNTLEDNALGYDEESHGIYVTDSSDVVVIENEVTETHTTGNYFHDESGVGVFVENSPDPRIESNVVDANRRTGIQIHESARAHVEANALDDNNIDHDEPLDSGITLSGSPNSTVVGNVVERHASAMRIGSNETLVEANTVRDNDDGINVISTETGVTVRDNLVEENVGSDAGDGRGISVFGVSDVLVENNTVRANTLGISASTSGDPITNVTVRENTVSNHEEFDTGLTHQANGIALGSVVGATVADNVVTDSDREGIRLRDDVDEIAVANNSVTGHDVDLGIEGVTNATIVENTFASGLVLYGDDIDEPELDHFDHQISDNTVGGDPLYYAVGEDGGSVEGSYGQIVLIDTTDVTVDDHAFYGPAVGVQVALSDGVAVTNTTVYGGANGIIGTNATGLTVTDSAVVGSGDGISLHGDASGTTVLGSTVSTTDRGIFVAETTEDVTVSQSAFRDNEIGLESDVYDQAHNASATDNWWGDETGPSGDRTDPVTGVTADGSGDEIATPVNYENVAFDPWEPDAPGTFFGVEIDVYNSLYGEEGDTLEVNVTVTNHGDEAGTQTLALFDPAWTALDEKAVTLDAGESTDVALYWETQIGDADTEELFAASEDSMDGADWVWLDPAPGGFDVAIDSTNAPVTEGDPLDVQVTVENTGGEESTQTIELERFDGPVVDSTEVTLGALSSEQLTLTWETEAGDAGDGEVTVLSEDDSVSEAVSIDEPETTGTVAGTVVDGETGDPIEGVWVALNTGSENVDSTTTDADGTYELSAESGTYDVIAAVEYYDPHTEPAVEIPVGETVSQDFELFPTDSSGTLAGTVTDAADGDPIEAATVELLDGDGEVLETATTDDSGAYELSHSPGTYDVRFGAATYEFLTVETVEIESDAGTEESVALDRETIGARFSIAITDVTDPVFVGEPLAIEAAVENTGDEQGTQSIELHAGGDVLEATTVTLGPEESTSVSLEWVPDSADVGVHDVSVWSEDDVDHASAEVLPEGAGYVVGASLDVYDGDESVLEQVSIDAAVDGDDVSLRLVSDDSEPTDDPSDAIAAERDLSSVGVDPGSTWFEIEVQLENVEPDALGGTAELEEWWTESNADGTTNVTVRATTLGTEVLIDCDTYDEADDCEPPLEAWPDPESAATHSLQSTVDLTLSDLSALAEGDATAGAQVITDAQRFGFDEADGERLTVDLGAPARGVDDQPNEGIFVGTVPDGLLDAWGVETTDEIAVEYGDDPVDSTVTETADGYRVDVDLTHGDGPITIRPDVDEPATFEVSVQSTSDPVPEGATIIVDAIVENVGDETGSEMVQLTHPAQGLLYEVPVVDLEPGETRLLEFQWWTEEGDVGTHDLSVVTDSHTAETTVEVEELGLGVSVFPEPATENTPIIFQTTYADDPVWDFDDGATALGSKVYHSFEDAGTYDVTLTDGETTETVAVEITEPEMTIVQLDPVYGGQPLQGVPWEETFQAGVFSDESVEQVTFELDGETIVRDGSTGAYAATFDLGELDDDAELTITAEDQFGATTEATRMVRVTDAPEWIQWIIDGDGDVVVDREAGTIEARHTPVDVEQELGIEGVPVLPDVDLQSFELSADAIAAYTADPVGADVEGDGTLGATLLGQGIGGEIDADGTVDSTLSLETATIAASASRTGIEGPTVFGGAVEGQEDNQLEDVIVPWTIDPSVEFEGHFGEDFSFEEGTVQSGTDITILHAAELFGCGVFAEGGGGMTASFDVGPETDLNPGGSLSVDGEIVLDCYYEFEFELGPFEGDVGSGGLGLQATGAHPGPVTVSPPSADGPNPLPGVPTVDDELGGGDVDAAALATDVETTDADGTDFDRLTDRPFEDTQPAIETVGDELIVVYSAQNESKAATDGRDLRVRTHNLTTGTWSAAADVTDDDATDETPALAASQDGTAVVWSTLEDAPPIEAVETPADLFGHYEIAVAIDDGAGWSEPDQLTVSERRQHSPSIVAIDGGWLVAWTSTAADGSDSNVRYTVLDDEGERETIETIENASHPAVGTDGGGATLAYAAVDDAGNETVVTAHVDGEGLVESHRHATNNVVAVTTADGRTVWANASRSNVRVFDADGEGSPTELAFEDELVNVDELELDAHEDDAVLTYRARFDGGSTVDLGYRLDRGDGWIADHAYAELADENLTAWHADVAVGESTDAFYSTFAVQELDRSAVNDVFVTERAFAPAYAIEATASAASAGDESTIAYDLRNVGDRPSTGDVTVVIENETDVVEVPIDTPLEPGVTESGEIDAIVDASGTFDVSVAIDDGDATNGVADTADTLGDASTSETADETTVVAATPRLSVDSVDSSMIDGGDGNVILVEAVIDNAGGATAVDVPIAFDDGTEALETVDLGAIEHGENATATITVDPDAIDTSVADSVSIGTGQSIDESAVANGARPTWFVQPDLDVAGVEYLDVGGDQVAEVLIANRGFASANTTVTVTDEAGDVVGNATRFVAEATLEEPAFETVDVPLEGVAEGAAITVVADTTIPDADPSTTGLTDEVGPFADVSRPSFAVDIHADETVGPNDELAVTLDVANPGYRSDTQPITLLVDGAELETRTVALDRGEKRTETFAVEPVAGAETIDLLVESLTPQDAKTVTVDGDDPSPPPALPPVPSPDPASFTAVDLDVPSSVDAGDSVTVSTTVENVGEETGTATLALSVDGEVVSEEPITLDGGGSITSTFELSTASLDPGSIEIAVAIDGSSSSTTLEIVDEADSAGGPSDDPAETPAPSEDESDDPAADAPGDDADDSIPGFGVEVGLIALLLVTAARMKRRSGTTWLSDGARRLRSGCRFDRNRSDANGDDSPPAASRVNRREPSAADRPTNRRRWLRLCAGVGVVGTAGCLGDDDSGGDGNDGSTGPDGGPGGVSDDDASGGESIELGPEDGWSEPHGDVEVPDQPGTAILQVGGERVELTGIGYAGEEPGVTGTTGAEQFEADGTFMGGAFQGSEIQVAVTRMIGYEDTSGTWAASDSISFARGGVRLGNVIYRLYEDGRLADSELAGDIPGRRFVDESFVRISPDGVLTAVETIESHEDESLDGQFAFGARLQDGWNQR